MLSSVQLVLLFFAGGCGTLSRFGFNVLVGKCVEHPTPWSTTAVNITGCLFFGFIAAMFESRHSWNLETKTIILTGFFGAFTTFSTYMYEVHTLLEGGRWPVALVAFFVQNGIGLAAIALGIAIAKWSGV